MLLSFILNNVIVCVHELMFMKLFEGLHHQKLILMTTPLQLGHDLGQGHLKVVCSAGSKVN